MKRTTISDVFQSGIVAVCLAAFLFTGGMLIQGGGFIALVFREVATVCRDATIQWMLVVCLVVYLAFFWFLERRTQFRYFIRPADNLFRIAGEKENVSRIWLVVFVVICLAGYAWHYSATEKSLQMLVLLMGMVFGKAVSTWALWHVDRSKQRTNWLVLWLICLLVGAASDDVR